MEHIEMMEEENWDYGNGNGICHGMSCGFGCGIGYDYGDGGSGDGRSYGYSDDYGDGEGYGEGYENTNKRSAICFSERGYGAGFSHSFAWSTLK
jgi:hypothetical protein